MFLIKLIRHTDDGVSFLRFSRDYLLRYTDWSVCLGKKWYFLTFEINRCFIKIPQKSAVFSR